MLGALLFFVSLCNYGADFVVGKDYEIIANSDAIKSSGNNVEVAEFFSFGCPWCYRLEPALTHWLDLHKSGIIFKKGGKYSVLSNKK